MISWITSRQFSLVAQCDNFLKEKGGEFKIGTSTKSTVWEFGIMAFSVVVVSLRWRERGEFASEYFILELEKEGRRAGEKEDSGVKGVKLSKQKKYETFLLCQQKKEKKRPAARLIQTPLPTLPLAISSRHQSPRCPPPILCCCCCCRRSYSSPSATTAFSWLAACMTSSMLGRRMLATPPVERERERGNQLSSFLSTVTGISREV